jgi:hypothetical protein
VLPSAKVPTLAEILSVETGVVILARTLPNSRRGCAAAWIASLYDNRDSDLCRNASRFLD